MALEPRQRKVQTQGLSLLTKCPRPNERCKKLPAPDVDIFGTKSHKIIRSGDGIGRDVDTEGNDDETNSCKSGSSTSAGRARVHPVPDDIDLCVSKGASVSMSLIRDQRRFRAASTL